MSYCPACGAVNEPESLSCAACGRVLASVCTRCNSRNATSARFCQNCGQTFGADASSGAAAVRRSSGKPEMPPHGPFLKAVIGGFVFILLYLSEALSGTPLLGILIGLISGAVALWGLVELVWWLIHRLDAQSGGKPGAGVEDLFPAAVNRPAAPMEGSFADLDAEAAGESAIEAPAREREPARSPNRETASEPPIPGMADFEPSMVAASSDGDDLAPKKKKKRPASPTAPATAVSEQAIDPANDELAALEESASAGQASTLSELLDQGVEQEIALVERKLHKTPRNFSLLMRVAQLYEERGEIDKAISAMEHCLSFNPQDPEVYLFHGILLRRANQADKARKAIEHALKMNPYMSKAYYQLGSLERAAKNLATAREAFQRGIQLSPDDPYAHYQLGMVYRELGDLGLAQMELKRACLLNPGDSYGHSQLGQIYQLSKKWDFAVSEYSLALSLKPNDSYVLEKLAEVMVEKSELARALDLYQEALSHQFHPEPRTMIASVRILHRLGRIREMKPILEEVLRVSPGNPDGLFLLGQALSAEKDIEGALKLFLSVVGTQPDRWEAWLEMGKLYQSLDRNDDALASFIKASPNATDQAGIWNTIGILLSGMRRYDEALRAFKKAVSYDYSDSQIQANLRAVQKKVESACRRTIESAGERLAGDPRHLDAYLEMGQAYELLDRPEDALIAYQKLLSIKPDSIDGLLAYAKLLKLRGKLKMAMRCYREILKIDHHHADARLQLVKSNLSLGFINEALRHAVAVQKLSPDDPEIHFLLGKIYFAKGMAPRALKEFSFVATHAKDHDLVSWAEIMRRRLSKTI